MSETQELKLACLHHAGGDLDKAKAHYEWVIGSAPEASEQRATDQPEQPFNYRHPSKHDGSMPRRCYLDQLTPEELMIRDVAATVEGLGAHPLLTATVIKLMQAGEALADWVDIGLRDKAIQALLDPVPSPSHEPSSQETVTEAAEEDPTAVAIAAYIEAESGSVQPTDEDGALIRMGYGDDDETPTDAERTSVVTDHDRVEPEDLPKLSDSDFQALPKFEEGEREILAEFLKRPGAVQAQPGEYVEVTNERRHWLYSSGYIHTGADPVIVWPTDRDQGRILAYAPVAPFSGVEAMQRQAEADIKREASNPPAETAPPPSEPQSQSEGVGERVEQTENPAAQMFGKALAAESEAKEQRKYNPFAIFGAKVDA